MNSFILYVSFSHCSVVGLRLLALKILFLSVVLRLQKQGSDKFSSSLMSPGYRVMGGEVGAVVAASWVRPSPGLWSSKKAQENHNFSPLLTLLPLVCHGAALLTADPLHRSHCQLCSSTEKVLGSKFTSLHHWATFSYTFYFIRFKFTLSPQSHSCAKSVTSSGHKLLGLNQREELESHCHLQGFTRPLRPRHWYTDLSSLFAFFYSFCLSAPCRVCDASPNVYLTSRPPCHHIVGMMSALPFCRTRYGFDDSGTTAVSLLGP